MGINKETTREERAEQFKRDRWFRDMSESEIVDALCDFANAECVALDKENTGLQKQVNEWRKASKTAVEVTHIMGDDRHRLDERIESLTAQLAAMWEAMEYAVKRLDCEYAYEDGCIEKAQIKLKSAIVQSDGKVV